jgi:hypothetical protein
VGDLIAPSFTPRFPHSRANARESDGEAARRLHGAVAIAAIDYAQQQPKVGEIQIGMR